VLALSVEQVQMVREVLLPIQVKHRSVTVPVMLATTVILQAASVNSALLAQPQMVKVAFGLAIAWLTTMDLLIK
jgi:hypothetical protein